MSTIRSRDRRLYNKDLAPTDKKKKNWRIVGVDPDGFDLRNKQTLARYCFEKSVTDVKKLRGLFVSLHKKASA